MPQLSLYMSDRNFEILKLRAGQAGVSMSKYANMLIERDAAGEKWPEGFWGLYGAVSDVDFAVPEDALPVDDAAFESMFE